MAVLGEKGQVVGLTCFEQPFEYLWTFLATTRG